MPTTEPSTAESLLRLLADLPPIDDEFPPISDPAPDAVGLLDAPPQEPT